MAMVVPWVAGLALPSVPATSPPPRLSTAPGMVALQARLAAVAHDGPARIGLAAIDVTTGQMVSYNGGERFPMASTVKVAIAAAFLEGVEQGRLALERSYALPADERRLAARIGNMQSHRGSLTGAQLIDLMLTRSDNTAADILLHAIGGTRGVAAWLDDAGVTGQRVDRSIAQLLSDHEATKRMRVGRGRHRHWITVSVSRAAPRGDNRDSSTPEAMAALLAKLRGGELLDATRTAYLFDVMAQCRTGPNRIRGLLPANTPVAHKTGTMNGVTDDVGVVELPNGHPLAIAIFEHGGGGVGRHDRSIARLARMLYDGFATGSRTAMRESGAGNPLNP